MSGLDDPSGDTWQRLVYEFRDRLGLNDPANASRAATTEHDFRETLTELCAENRERDETRQINRFRRGHVHIINFVTAIDGTNRFERDHALQPLIWQLMTCAARAAFTARKRLRDIAETTQKLNDQLPKEFSQGQDRLFRFPYEPKVQKPLQEFLKEYLNCYLSMFSDFATYPGVLCIAQYEQRVKSAAAYFKPRADEWVAAIQIAQADQQRWMGTASVATSQYATQGLPSPSFSSNFNLRHIKDLGSGTYGEVSMVMESTTRVLYAQKMIRPRGRRDSGALARIEEQVKSEVNIMQRLRHDHIASVLMCSRDDSAFRLIMQPVADCDLRTYLEDFCVDQDFPKDKLRNLDSWFGCLTSALAYAHEKSVKHEDIKPSNILIKDDQPYLSDFGSAKDFSKLEAGSISPDQNMAGTPVYWCPEETKRGRRADVFSLGCVFSEMLTVRQKRSLQDYRSARQVQGTDYPIAFRKNLPAVETWLRELEGVEQRYTVQALLLAVIQDMLEVDPEDRPTAMAVKKKFRAEGETLFCNSCQ